MNCVQDQPPFVPYDIYVFLYPGSAGAMAAEYLMEGPWSSHLLMGFRNNDFIPIYTGNPVNSPGISLAFDECQTNLVWLQKLTFLPTSAAVEYIYLGPHDETDMIAVATCEYGYPKKEASSLNPFGFNECWYPTSPTICAVEATSPISIRVDFTPCINSGGSRTYYTHFTMYNAGNPADTVRFIEAYQFVDNLPGFFLVTDSEMVPGTTYLIEADDVCCAGFGCNDSSFMFNYEGGFADRPDLDIIIFRAPLAKPDSCAAIPIEFSVINNGNMPVDSFDIFIEYGENPTPILTLYHETHYDLHPGESVHRNISASLPNTSSPAPYLFIDVDTEGKVAEWIEFNNDFWRAFRNYNPVINIVEDYPGDNGGKAILRFNASFYDYMQAGPRVDYEIYRRSLDNQAWSCIDTILGTRARSYNVTVPTEADSTDHGGLIWSVFTVNAVIDYGLESYMSCADSGYSIDNLGDVGTLLLSSSLDLEGRALKLAWSIGQPEDPGDPAFEIRRSENGGPYDIVLDPLILNDENSFWFEDISVQSGRSYRYRLYYCSNDETRNLLLETDLVLVPSIPLTMMQNRPNPFNPSTEIRYYLPQGSYVNLTVYDITGKVVACLVNETKERGDHVATWDGTGRDGNKVSSGIYIYRIKAGKESVSKKMVLLR